MFVPPLQEELPPPPAPAGTYNPVVIIGKTVYVSGIGPLAPDASSHLAKVGAAEDKARSSVIVIVTSRQSSVFSQFPRRLVDTALTTIISLVPLFQNSRPHHHCLDCRKHVYIRSHLG